MFRNRNDAALQLAARLKRYKGQNPLVLGIPRGGAVIASMLARELKGDLDIILTRKLGTPGSPELAMGSIDEAGNLHLNLSIISALRISKEQIEKERLWQMDVIRRRAESYRRIYPKISLEGRTVIITDDGIATGATLKVAIDMVKAAGVERTVVAIPVGPPENVAEIKQEVDDVTCLLTPANFQAVGQFYESFNQVEDEDVERILRNFAKTRA
jgi:putative phosphoribosyl transferase